MKSETAAGRIFDVTFQAMGNTAECHFVPRNVRGPHQADLEALIARRMIRCGEMPAIKQMDLIYMGDADHGERCIDGDSRASLFESFPDCSFGGGFTVFHETCGECPIADSRLDGTSAQENFVFPRRDATHHQPGVFIVDVTAALADKSRNGVACRYFERNVGATARAEFDHEMSALISVIGLAAVTQRSTSVESLIFSSETLCGKVRYVVKNWVFAGAGMSKRSGLRL